jgi:hypothetical protein
MEGQAQGRARTHSRELFQLVEEAFKGRRIFGQGTPDLSLVI